jgi:spermidine/putrescine transport system substrate-binding protein
MSERPMQRRNLSRRQFMQRAGASAIAVPSLAAVLAACSKPGETGGGSGSTTGPIKVARPGDPVTLPLNGEPIPASTPIEEGATLQVYNWDAYMYKKVLQAFEDEYNVKVEWTTFNNMEEGIQKLVSGQVKPDVFFPTTDYLSRLVQTDLIQPLNHELIPNMTEVVWPAFSDPGPWYDQGWQYTVPYTIYTTGVAYRRDHISDDIAQEAGYDLLWDPKYSGKISYYDSYRDALGMAMVRNGDMDPNSGDPVVIDRAQAAVEELLGPLQAKLTINGAYAKLPEDEFWVAQSWSGDIVGGQFYLPKGTDPDVLGYWYPDDHIGLIGNDTIVIPTTSKSPRLAHEFLNFFLDKKWGFINFADWNGYQPPFSTINPDDLVSDGVVPEGLPRAVVTEDMFTQGLVQGQLKADVDDLWLDAWNQIQAGS